MATKKNQRKKKTRGPDKHGKGSASAAKDHSQNAPMQQTLPEDTLSQKSFTENALPQYGRVLEKVDLAETPAPSAEMNIKYPRTNELVSPPISTTDPQSTLRDTDQENVGPGSENLTDVQKGRRTPHFSPLPPHTNIAQSLGEFGWAKATLSPPLMLPLRLAS